MKTQKILNLARLMTFMTVFGIMSITAHAEMTHDEDPMVSPGGGPNSSVEATEQLEMEKWMVDDDFWRVEISGNMGETLPLEDWMTDQAHFQTREQRKLDAIEDWMVDTKFWTI